MKALLTGTKKHMLAIVIVVVAGIFAIISSIFMGYFGLAIVAFTGLLACSTVLVFVIPFLMGSDSD